MANGHSRNKRGRGNPRARHGPAPQPRPNARHAIPPTTIPPSAPPTPRAPEEDATPQPTAPLPGGRRPRPPSRTEPRQRARPGPRPPREAGWNSAEEGSRANGPNAAISANGTNGASGGRGTRSRGIPSTPAPPSAERITPTEEPPAPTAAPPRPISREQGWRAQPPRGARPREAPTTLSSSSPSVDQTEAGLAPPLDTRPPLAPIEDEPEEHAELVVHTQRSPQRPPSVIVAPNGHAPFRPEVRGALGPLIDELHDLFARDRAIASQGGNARCGICYLHHPLGELDYHETEGFYVCLACQQALGHATINMVRRQQR